VPPVPAVPPAATPPAAAVPPVPAVPPAAAVPPVPAVPPVAAPGAVVPAPVAPAASVSRLLSPSVAQEPPAPAALNPEQAVPPAPPGVGPGVIPADKPADAVNVQPGEQIDRRPTGLSLSLGAGMNFGSSTFAGNGYTSNPMVDWSMSFSPSYSFADWTRISASTGISQELSQSDGDDQPQTLLFSDIQLSVARPLYSFDAGPRISGSLSSSLPLSTSSRADSLITTLGLGLNIGQGFGKFGVGLGAGFRKNFHRYTHPTRDANTRRALTTREGMVIEDVVTGIARQGGNELAGSTYFNGATNNTSMVMRASLNASYAANDRLGFNISYGLSKSFSYESYALDEFSSPYASEGRGVRDAQTGMLSGNYAVLENLAFGLGLVTAGGMFSADNKRYRFPFYALEGADSNLTTFFVNATYTEAIPL
jgi:hypothetical protein